MFYFLIAPYLSYNIILIVAAIVPAIYLLIKVYRSDRLEKESPKLLRRLVFAGIFSTQIAIVLERLTSNLLTYFVSPDTIIYRVILYFVIVALSEEGSKYFMLKRTSWNSYEFNCIFDGIVYATFASLGFALWENISYVVHYGLGNAFVRAFTAIPGHACFGVFMGIFYSAARMAENAGDGQAAGRYKFLSILVPVLIHGAYDYIATIPTNELNIAFIVFIVILFLITNQVIKNVSNNDQYMNQ